MKIKNAKIVTLDQADIVAAVNEYAKKKAKVRGDSEPVQDWGNDGEGYAMDAPSSVTVTFESPGEEA